MKFMVKWNIQQDKWVAVLKVWTSMTPAERADAGAGVKVVGRWHDVNARSGMAILESADAAAVGVYLTKWNTLCDIEVAPVLDDEESAAVGKKALAGLGA